MGENEKISLKSKSFKIPQRMRRGWRFFKSPQPLALLGILWTPKVTPMIRAWGLFEKVPSSFSPSPLF